MTNSSAAKKKQPFPYQAAQTAIWAPIIAVILGVLSQTATHDFPAAGLIIGGCNILLCFIGLIMSIIALCAIPKYGSRKLLTPGIYGLFLNALILSAFAFAIFLLPKLLHPTPAS